MILESILTEVANLGTWLHDICLGDVSPLPPIIAIIGGSLPVYFSKVIIHILKSYIHYVPGMLACSWHEILWDMFFQHMMLNNFPMFMNDFACG